MAPYSIHRLRFFNYTPLSIDSLSYSSSLQLLALSRSDNSIELWSLAEGQSPFRQRWMPGTETYSIEGLTWSGLRKNRLFSTGLQGSLIEHDVNRCVVKKEVFVTGGPAWCCSSDELGARIAVGTEEGLISLLKVSSKGSRLEVSKVFDKQEGRVLCIDWHVEGRILATGSADTVRLWDSFSGHPLQRMSTGRGETNKETTVWSLALMSDLTIMTGDSRGKTSFWNGKTGTCLDSYQTHKADVLCVHVSKDEKIAFSSGIDPTIMHFQPLEKGGGKGTRWVKSIHRIANAHDVRSLLRIGSETLSVGVDAQLVINLNRSLTKIPPIPPGKYVALAHKAHCILLRKNDSLQLWKLGELTKLVEVSSTDGELITTLGISQNAQYFGYGTRSRLRVFEFFEKELKLQKINFSSSNESFSENLIIFMEFTFDASLLTISSKGTVSFHSREGNFLKHIYSLSKKTLGIIGGVSNLSGNDTVFALSDYGNNVCIFDALSSSVIHRVPFTDVPITALAIHPNCTTVLIVYSNHNIVEVSFKTGTYTEFSQSQLSSLDWPRKRKIPIHGIFYVFSSSEEKIICYDTTSIYVITKSGFERGGSSRGKKMKESSGESSYLPSSCPVFILNKYQYLLFLQLINDKEMVALEVMPSSLDDSLPPSLLVKKFGGN